MKRSTTQLLSRPGPAVTCHCTPVSLLLSTPTAGLPPLGAPVPANGMNIVVVVIGGIVSVSWGENEPGGPAPLAGSNVASVWMLSLVEYCAVQSLPVTTPLMSNWTPV